MWPTWPHKCNAIPHKVNGLVQGIMTKVMYLINEAQDSMTKVMNLVEMINELILPFMDPHINECTYY